MVLSEHGITCTYDEVQRFRKSAANFATSNSAIFEKELGLTTDIGLLSGWCDNYDLWVSSPNGMTTTHAMVSEIIVNPYSTNNANQAPKKKNLQSYQKPL